MSENLDSVSHSLAMFASGNKNSNNPQPRHHGDSNRGRGRNNSNRGRGGGRFNGSGGGPHQFYTSQPHQNYNTSQTAQLGAAQFGGQAFKNERPICQICGKAGHIAVDCYHRMDFAYQGKNPPTKLAAMASASNAALTNCQDPWLADSGFLDHLTANLNNLSVQSQYKGSK